VLVYRTTDSTHAAQTRAGVQITGTAGRVRRFVGRPLSNGA
jgi:hypothetical protein